MLAFLATLQQLVANIRRDDEGATMVEYGLLVALIAVVVAAAAAIFGTQMAAMFTTISGQL